MTGRHRVGVVFAFITLAGGGAWFTASDAVAQSAQTCSCLAAAPVSGIVGQFTQVRGDVQMSQAGGYAGVGAGAPIYPGARIMTGPQASASLAIGANCALDVPANATVSINPVQGGMCVSLDAQEAATGPANSGPGILPVLLGAGAVGGGAALAIGLQDDDDAVSR